MRYRALAGRISISTLRVMIITLNLRYLLVGIHLIQFIENLLHLLQYTIVLAQFF